MAIYNKMSTEKILEINARLGSRKDGNHPNCLSSGNDSFINFMNAGMAKIEASKTKDLMFAGSDDE